MLEISFQSDSKARGTLLMDEERVALTALSQSGIAITQSFLPDRERVESFIATTYRREYGSLLAHHYPTLMSVHDSSGTVLAATGFRLASEDRLFLEQYLPLFGLSMRGLTPAWRPAG
jgi:hypothetical protein